MLDIELLQLRHDLAQIVVGRRREVEAADERVDLVDAADRLGASERIYDTGMSAGTDHDEAAIAEPEACGVLVPMLVGLRLTGQLLRREMVVRVGIRVAAEPVLDAEFDPAVR